MRLNDFKHLVKRNRFLYRAYYHIMSFWINVIRILVKTDDQLILFVSFGGRRFTDSPRAIYEAMQKDSRFAGYKLTWAFIEPEQYPQIENRVRIDTFAYYKTEAIVLILEGRFGLKGVHCKKIEVKEK